MNKMERAEKVCELYREGKTKEEIAEAVGCSPTSINHYLNVGGITRVKKIESVLPMIFKLRQEGKTLKEISDATGFHQTTISSELNKRGMGTRDIILIIMNRKLMKAL